MGQPGFQHQAAVLQAVAAPDLVAVVGEQRFVVGQLQRDGFQRPSAVDSALLPIQSQELL
ncbi:hypothetical protein D3C71_2121840 [compost metagenome]